MAKALYTSGSKFSEGWNFGPSEADSKSVRWITDYLKSKQPGLTFDLTNEINMDEASILKLNSSKATKRLNWSNRWNLKSSIDMTLEWHSEWLKQRDMQKVTRKQIESYLFS